MQFRWTLRNSSKAYRGDYMENPMKSDSQGYCRVCHDVGPLGERCRDCWRTIAVEVNQEGVECLNWFQKKYHAIFVDTGFTNSKLKVQELPCNEELTKEGELMSVSYTHLTLPTSTTV